MSTFTTILFLSFLYCSLSLKGKLKFRKTSRCAANFNEQSPIDLIITNAELSNKFKFTPSSDYTATGQFSWDGHTYKANIINCKSCNVVFNRNGNKNTYNLLQFHVHFPNEHHIMQKITDKPREEFITVHMVHKTNDRVNRKFLVLGFLLERDNNGDGTVNLNTDATSTINLNEIWKNTSQYFYYKGGLTTKPYSQVIQWIFIKQTFKIKKDQFDAIRSGLELKLPKENHGHNNRDIQDLCNRKVYIISK